MTASAVEPGLDGGEEHVELGEEAGERRNAGEREHQHRQHEGHHRIGPRQAGEIADVLDHVPPLRRMARMQAKVPSVMAM